MCLEVWVCCLSQLENSGTPLEGSNYDFGAGGVGDGAQYPPVPGFPAVAAPFFPSFASALQAGSARAEQSAAGDVFGAFTVQGHFSPGVAWSRALLLTAEGALVAVDSLAVAAGDAAGAGWLAGPSWLLQATAPGTAVAPNAFEFQGFNYTGCYGSNAGPSPERLLVALFAPGAPPGAAVAGTKAAAFDGRVLVESAFIRTQLGAGPAPTRFVSVLLPHGPAAAPAPLAARVAAAREGAATVVSVPLEAGGAATVRVGDDGSWSVTRS